MDPEENTNFYQPEDSAESAQAPAGSGKKASSVSWTASEYVEHQHGAGWYLALVAGTALLAAGTYFLTKDYFAAGTIAFLGIIVALFVGHKPGQITYEVSASGLRVGEKSYSYGMFKSFSIIQEGPLGSLNFYPLKRFMSPISAFYDPKDEDRIVSVIGEYLPLENRQPDGFDRLSRRLKL